jgi:hypothetical protein
MSLPDRNLPTAYFAQEEAIEGLARNFEHLLERMPPVARLRLMAFMHLIENPESLNASLELKPSGQLSLTLDTLVAPTRGHQH